MFLVLRFSPLTIKQFTIIGEKREGVTVFLFVDEKSTSLGGRQKTATRKTPHATGVQVEVSPPYCRSYADRASALAQPKTDHRYTQTRCHRSEMEHSDRRHSESRYGQDR